MLEILTIFLGLVSGTQEVELAVGAPVAAVEVELDGEQVGWLTAPPWRLEVDLGEALAPHELIAIARDDRGRELARARRWINIDPPRVEVAGQAPAGGLTPLPVIFDSGEPPAPDEMDGWFVADGAPLAVPAVHAGPAEVVVVLHPAARPALEELARVFLTYQLDRLGVPARAPRLDSPAWQPELLRMPREEFERAALEVFDVPRAAPESLRLGGLWRAYHELAHLGDGTAVRFISPLAAPISRTSRPRQLFAASSGVADVGLFWLAENVPPMAFACRLADAVAIAGREAHAGGRRRAVVLLLDGEGCNESLFNAAAARGYLRALRVPLLTWNLSPPGTPSAWGEARFIGLKRSLMGGSTRAGNVAEAFQRFGAAAAELRDALAAQSVVLLAGQHLPHRIEVAGAAGRARPAGLQPAATGGEPR